MGTHEANSQHVISGKVLFGGLKDNGAEWLFLFIKLFITSLAIFLNLNMFQTRMLSRRSGALISFDFHLAVYLGGVTEVWALW